MAIIGGGMAGLLCAWLLRHVHRVTLFEREPFLGGHAHTVFVECDGARVPAETGFKYFMDGSHALLLRLLALLGLRPRRRPSSLTITDRVRDRVLVLPPRRPAQIARLALAPARLPELLALRRFMASADRVVQQRIVAPTVPEHAAALGLRDAFIERLLLPLCASSWGAPIEVMRGISAYSVLKNMWKGAQGFYELDGGISSYVEALARQLDGVEMRPGHPVEHLQPSPDGRVQVPGGGPPFDQVVVATEAWTAARLLGGLPGARAAAAVLGRFQSFDSHIVIHGDTRAMPAARSDWSAVNHVFDRDRVQMTEWSGRTFDRPVFRSWLPPGAAPPTAIHAERRFRHLILSPAAIADQERLWPLQGQGRTWVCGMYTMDVDNHDSALRSAVEVARQLAPGSPGLRALRERPA